MKDYADRVSQWIREHAADAGLKGAVVGVSGGIDSAVVAVLCKRAFPKDTLALLMPCQSGPQDTQDAQSLVNKFDIPYFTIDLGDVYNEFLSTLVKNVSESHYIAEANIKSRLRMTTLYYYANLYEYIVAGTGNKVEILTGYFTKYGDGGVDIEPLGNLVKGEVYELAEFLGIPQNIIQKPPSAGLWVGQSDQQEMGIAYEELDRYVKTGEADRDVKKHIENMISGSAHKREVPPAPDF